MVSYLLVRHPHGSLSSVLRLAYHAQLVLFSLLQIVHAHITPMACQVRSKVLNLFSA
jgi:hypothetical protein